MSEIEDRAALIAEAGEYADAIQGGESDNWKRLVVCVDNLANALAQAERVELADSKVIDILQAHIIDLDQKLTERAATIDAAHVDIYALIDDLFLARANGTIYTYGNIQARLGHTARILMGTEGTR